MPKSAVAIIAFLWLTVPLSPSIWIQSAPANDVIVTLRSGTSLHTRVDVQSINWTSFNKNGALDSIPIPMEDIQWLRLSEKSMQARIEAVRQLLDELSDDQYRVREAAETKLLEPEIGKPLLSVIEGRLKSAQELDLQYRLNRIIGSLRASRMTPANNFDQIRLNDGRKLQGAVESFATSVPYFGRQLAIDRSTLYSLSTSAKKPTAFAAEPVGVRLFHLDNDKDFYQSNQERLSFETDLFNNPLNERQSVNDLFASQGLRLRSAEAKKYVAISSFGFQRHELRPRDNSIRVENSVGQRRSTQFTGIMEFTFTDPLDANRRAGVREFSLFLASIAHQRDILLEAYNADGQLIGVVESTNRQCVFSGIKSTEPIYRLRVLSNPYLLRVKRRVDRQYAVDEICFSQPVNVGATVGDLEKFIRLNDGSLLKFDSFEMSQNQIVVTQNLSSQPLSIPLDEIQILNIGNSHSPNNKLKLWKVMLSDRSVLLANLVNGTFISNRFGKIPAERIVAAAAARNSIRFPQLADFDQGSKVLVFPTCRLAIQDLKFSTSMMRWNADPIVLEEELIFPEFKQIDDEDPNPKFNSVSLENDIAAEIPTIWFRPAQTRDPNAKLLRLSDGQLFILDGAGKQEFLGVTKTGVKLKVLGKPYTFPWSQIQSLQLN